MIYIFLLLLSECRTSAPKGNALFATNSFLMSELQRFYSTCHYCLIVFVVKEVLVVVSALTMFSVSDLSSGKWPPPISYSTSGCFRDHSRKRSGPVTDTFPAARVVPTHLGLKDKTPPGIGVGGGSPTYTGRQLLVTSTLLTVAALLLTNRKVSEYFTTVYYLEAYPIDCYPTKRGYDI